MHVAGIGITLSLYPNQRPQSKLNPLLLRGGNRLVRLGNQRPITHSILALTPRIPIPANPRPAKRGLHDRQICFPLVQQSSRQTDLRSKAPTRLCEIAILPILPRLLWITQWMGTQMRPTVTHRIMLVRRRIADLEPEHDLSIAPILRQLFRLGIVSHCVGLTGHQNEIPFLSRIQRNYNEHHQHHASYCNRLHPQIKK